MASSRKQSIGRVISDLCRESLKGGGAIEQAVRNGVQVIQRDREAVPVTIETVNRLRDEVI
jgi:hypothetical protein